MHCHDHPELPPIVSLEESKATEEKETHEKPSPIESTDSVTHEELFKAQSKGSSGSTKEQNQNDVVYCGEKKRKKRPIGPLPVTPALLHKNIDKLLPVIESGEWLTDEHIDNAQAILAANFPYIGGLQATWVFISVLH